MLLVNATQQAVACTWAHLVGLYTLPAHQYGVIFSARGALADMLLWAVLRLQSRIYVAPTFDRCVDRLYCMQAHTNGTAGQVLLQSACCGIGTLMQGGGLPGRGASSPCSNGRSGGGHVARRAGRVGAAHVHHACRATKAIATSHRTPRTIY